MYNIIMAILFFVGILTAGVLMGLVGVTLMAICAAIHRIFK